MQIIPRFLNSFMHHENDVSFDILILSFDRNNIYSKYKYISMNTASFSIIL